MLTDDYEEFTEAQLKILEKYVTSTSGHVFALKNLPEVIKGALFSRYSRSNLGLRALLLKEFVSNEEEAAFSAITGSFGAVAGTQDDEQALSIQKAQNFYDRILDGYGDDSIGELGGTHVAIENISMLAAKCIEDSRIGGSPLEKSTRYVYFDQKVNGEYLFYREPILMTSAYRDLYIETSNMLFDTYADLIPPMTAIIEQMMPPSSSISKVAYNAALRAKVLDCLRGLLPAGTLTNMGVYGNGRFFDQLIHKLHVNHLAEMQDLGKRFYDELAKVMPSFIRRADVNHPTHKKYTDFFETMNSELDLVAQYNIPQIKRKTESGARLIDFDMDAPVKVAAALLYSHSDCSLQDLTAHCRSLSEEEIARILDAGCSARENRRQKSPRALEFANFTFEIVADFGIYRDLHRHRMLTQERQLLSCHYDFYVPPEIVGTPCEDAYLQALNQAKLAYDEIAQELPEEAQYMVPMAYNVRWYFQLNLRALQWMCELRSAAAGHSGYRLIAQSMAKQVIQAFPCFERFFKFVDYDGYELGRLGQEVRKEEKRASV